MSDEKHLRSLEKLFLALADKTRLRLLNLLRDNEVCVCFFTEALGESQPKISRHLAYLRNAGIVSTRRDGKWMHYKIKTPEDVYVTRILQNTLESLRSNSEMRADYDKLANACCATDMPTTIARAPKPDAFAQPNMFHEKRDQLETFLL